MARLACVDVANLPLQLLFKKHPKWQDLPAAVVSRDSPYGTILTVNARAGEYGITPGLRYAAGLSLNHELRADTIPAEMVAEGSAFLARELRKHSPQVEAAATEPGVYWLDAGGMSSLYPDLSAWCGKIRVALADAGFTATIAAGFTRFGCYAAAKSTREQVIFANLRGERKNALAAAIHILNLPAQVLERLELLGVRTVAAFLSLPPGAVGKRFGSEVRRLYGFAAGELDIPVQSTQARDDPQLVLDLPYAEYSSDRLLDYIRRALEKMTGELEKRHRLVRELRICFVLDGHTEAGVLLEPILPSSPSASTGLLTDLVSLRLEKLRLRGAVVQIRMSAVSVAERNIQEELFSSTTKQNLQEVDKVFSRLRAIYGNSCVQRARLENEHIPERSYSWEDLVRMPREVGGGARDRGGFSSAGAPAGALPGTLSGQAALKHGAEHTRRVAGKRRAVRRVFWDPCPLPGHRFIKRWGPYPLSGRWWLRERSRDYSYAETGDGEILWLCHDRADGEWRQIGTVE